MCADFSKLKRQRHRIPAFVKREMEKRDLMAAYRARPAYQQNDYIGWIKQAKREATKQKRLSQMLNELEAGGVYMNMPHAASAKQTRAKRSILGK